MFSFDLLLVDFGSGGLIFFFKTNFSLIKMEKQVTNHIYKKRKSATSLVVCRKQFIAESWIIKQIENISKLDSKT